MRALGVAAIGLALTACSYQAVPAVTQAVAVYTTHSTKVPGRYALVVETDEMRDDAKIRGFTCSAHSFPVDMRANFKASVAATMQGIVEEVTLASEGARADSLTLDGYDGVIRVRVEHFDVKMDHIQGFWSADIEADADLTAGLIVDKGDTRVVARTFNARKDAISGAGMACSGGAGAVAEATEEAVRSLLQQMAEEVARSPELRAGSVE